MSAAKPMGMDTRAGGYLLATGRRHFTARQWRRMMHKHNRAHGVYWGHWAEGCKGHATPRQRKRQAAS